MEGESINPVSKNFDLIVEWKKFKNEMEKLKKNIKKLVCLLIQESLI